MPALGLDVSLWNDSNSTAQQVDFAKAKANGAEFVFIKAGQWNFIDQDYLWNWKAAKAAGLLRGAYWYLDWRGDMDAQANMFASLLHDDPGELPPVCDFEMTTGCPADSASKLLRFVVRLENETKRFPIIYTSPGFWNAHGSTSSAWQQYDLWLAHWYANTPIVPKPWVAWKVWQYTEKGNGPAYGCESANVDLNYFSGSSAMLRAYAGITTPPEPTDAEKLDVLWAEYIKEHPATTINFPSVSNG
jgi:lysozyme